MNKSDIEDIVTRVYPQIVKDLGRAKKGTPKVEIHNNVLAMHSGIADHPGGENEHAEYDYKKNTIYLFKVALKSEQLVIQALLHEYTHATQDQKKYQAARADGYENNKYEKEAHKAERTWRKYIMKNENLNEGANANRWFDNLKFYYEKGLKSPDLRDPAEKKAYIKQAKQFFSKLREGLNEADAITERLKKGESGCCHACGWSHVKGAAHKKPYKTGKNSCANRKAEEITEDCGCGGRKRRDASYAIVEYLKTQEITEAEYQGRDVKLNKPMQGDTKKFKVYVKNAKGNVVKVNFGQKGMVIKKDNPEARKSFRARHKCDQKKDRTSPGYWSCKKW